MYSWVLLWREELKKMIAIAKKDQRTFFTYFPDCSMIFSPVTTMSSILVNIQQNYGEIEG